MYLAVEEGMRLKRVTSISLLLYTSLSSGISWGDLDASCRRLIGSSDKVELQWRVNETGNKSPGTR